MTNYRDQWRRKAMTETPAIDPRDYYTEEEITRVLELQAQRDTDEKRSNITYNQSNGPFWGFSFSRRRF